MRSLSLLLFILAAISLSLWRSAHAALDLTLKGTTRTYPLSGSLNVESGYGVLLWGNPKPWYGYARLFAQGATALTYNAGTVGVELYPISFLGVSVGSEWAENTADYSAYDCGTHLCRGKFRKDFVQGNLGLAAGSIFAFVRGTLEDHKMRGGTAQGYVEPTSGLLARGEGDRLKSLSGGVGYELNPSWRLLYLAQYNEMRELEGDSRMHIGAVSYQHGDWTALIGGGVFDSSLKKRDGTALVRLQWNIKPGLSVF